MQRLGDGSAWWAIVDFDIGEDAIAEQAIVERAFRVVGKCGHRRYSARGFARRAWGFPSAACILHGRRGEGHDLVGRRASFLRARRRESRAAAEAVGFRGPARESACARARGCVRRGARGWIREARRSRGGRRGSVGLWM